MGKLVVRQNFLDRRDRRLDPLAVNVQARSPKQQEHHKNCKNSNEISHLALMSPIFHRHDAARGATVYGGYQIRFLWVRDFS